MTVPAPLDPGSSGLLDAAPDAIIAVTADGDITFVNVQAERIFGYPRADLLGRPIDLLVPQAMHTADPAHHTRNQRDPQPTPTKAGSPLTARRRDGTEFPAEISLSSTETDDGRRVVVAVRDATDRIRAEAKFRGLLEAAPDAIVGIVADGTITLVNAQAERLFRYTRAELIGQPVEILVPDAVRDVHPARRTQFARSTPRPMGLGLQLSARRKDGVEFPVEISLSALDTEDGPLVLSAIRDVTDRLELQAAQERLKHQAEREQMEARLQQSQRLESLGQLAGGVAHDFNNLLAVMLNYAAFVAEQVAEAASEDTTGRWIEASGDIAQIQRAGDRATELVHQLLAFGRREVVRPQVLNLNTVVAEIEQLLRRTLGEHVQLHTVLAVDPAPVLADPGQLEQVLVNLAVNARDAMTEGGTLIIETADRILDAATAVDHPGLQPGLHAELRISDTGSGIAPEVAGRIFEPFYTTKAKGDGTGLGLATVYGIVTQAGGSVTMSSAVGAGTTFTVLLPATDESPAPVEQAPPRVPRRGAGETVLVVEDEEALREVTSRILTRNGYRVLTAADGPEALKIADHTKEHISLLLTDVIMPQMLGTELAEKMLRRCPWVSVLYMSGYAQPVLASQGTLAPGLTLVSKPFSETTLLQRVRQVLDT